MPTIYVDRNEAYRSRVEDIKDKQLFFYPVYMQALNCVKTIIEYTHLYLEDVKHNGKYCNRANPINLKGYPNNIIAFCAKRGCGKTSAMISFSKALENISSEDKTFWGDEIKGCKFYALESIDPTILESTDSVCRTVISRLFQVFSQHASSGYKDQKKRQLQQDLLEKFQKCFRLADIQKLQERKNEDYDDLQLLTELGDSANFKKEIHELITKFLEFMNDADDVNVTSQNSFLIIQIDDVDMNITKAYEVVEDIRKYFVLPNTIILFAMDMSLLEQTIEGHFIKAFEPVIKGDIAGDKVTEHIATQSRMRCHNTAVNYLDKLIPGIHRINLPDIDAELHNPLKVLNLAFIDNSTPCEETRKQKEREKTGEYQKVLSEALKKKCQIEIYNDSSELHPFLPRRMRELSHFVTMLNTMKDVRCTKDQFIQWAYAASDEGEDDLRTLRHNLEMLMDYFLHEWCESRLDHLQCTVIEELHHLKTRDKVAATMDMIMKHYGDEMYFEAYNRKDETPWNQLIDCILQLKKNQQDIFACAIGHYFSIYKEIILTYDFENAHNQFKKGVMENV